MAKVDVKTLLDQLSAADRHELRQLLDQADYQRGGGSIEVKVIKGREYLYLRRWVGKRRTSVYLGKRSGGGC